MKKVLILSMMVMAFFGCKEESDPKARVKMLIANSKLASDPHSWSKPNDARVTHLEWNAKVDFNSRTIHATATYDIEADTNVIIFDTKRLAIESVVVDGKPANFSLGEEKEFLGQSLSVLIDSTSKKVAITYTTAPDAEALLWVEGESPFLFTQSQAILARTWIPCQDSPGVRFTYNAQLEVPSDLLALMSAENPQQKSPDGKYTFKMDQPIPSYLMALAVGDIVFKPVGDRTGVYAIPSLIDKAAAEFEDMQMMVEAAEKLYGPYVWGRYDLLVLPPAFPFGGMENPKLTFATPTILAGDKSLVSLVAHELAHSWSGNLVTNSTWNDFWLNEGFTVYFEQRIMEAVYGRERSEMLAQLNRQDLDATLSEIEPRDSHLKLQLENRNPDDGMTDIAYNKGYFFLRLLEETVGREKFDVFLKDYFTKNSFKVMDTESFLSYLRETLVTTKELEDKINIDAWVYGPGLPSNVPSVNSARLDEVDKARVLFEEGKVKVQDIPWNNWLYQEQYRFISNLSDGVGLDKMTALDKSYRITTIGNNEVLFAWLDQSIKKKYEPAYPALRDFLNTVGRRKFVAPLFESLIATNQIELAKEIYATARPKYHAVTVETIDAMLKDK